MPDTTTTNPIRALHSSLDPELSKQLIVSKVEAKTPRRSLPSPIPLTSKEIVYETPKQGFIPGDGDVTEQEAAQTEDEEVNVATVASSHYKIRYP